jgi:hypothetical protein
MKFSLALLAVVATGTSAFAPQAAFAPRTANTLVNDRSGVVLEASKNKLKIASRTKWVEARGFKDGVAAKTAAVAAAGLMTNADGLEYVKLVHPDTGASSEIYLFGGVVTSYVDADGTEFIAVRPDAKMDGSKPISGGLSHCWPQVRPIYIYIYIFLLLCVHSLTVVLSVAASIFLVPSNAYIIE